jgi:hypothetical protein
LPSGFPESVVAPTGFALEGQRDAKRVYEKTESGRARDARQELHNSERAAPIRLPENAGSEVTHNLQSRSVQDMLSPCTAPG